MKTKAKEVVQLPLLGNQTIMICAVQQTSG